MKKSPPASRSAAVMLIESIVWIILTFLVRAQLDQAADRWQISPYWLILVKISIVLVMIAIAVIVHKLLFSLLVKRGIIPPERPE